MEAVYQGLGVMVLLCHPCHPQAPYLQIETCLAVSPFPTITVSKHFHLLLCQLTLAENKPRASQLAMICLTGKHRPRSCLSILCEGGALYNFRHISLNNLSQLSHHRRDS